VFNHAVRVNLRSLPEKLRRHRGDTRFRAILRVNGVSFGTPEGHLLGSADACVLSPAKMKPPAALRTRFDVFELDELDARLTREGVPVLLSPKTAMSSESSTMSIPTFSS
jgi:hypothetical protein